jgi:hypothetical protein
MLELKRRAPRCAQRGNMLPSRMTVRPLCPAGTDSGWMREVQMGDRLLGAERGGAAARGGRPGNPTRQTARHFNHEARFCCSFAADATMGNCRHNRLLQPAEAGDALPTDRPGGPSVAEGCGHVLSSGFTSGINQ